MELGLSNGEEIGVKKTQALSLHAGHRERLRDRARTSGFAGMPDYELLELFLFRSIPQRDVKPLAKALLARFGTLSGVLGANEEQLRTVKVEGSKLSIGKETALDLMALQEISLRAARAAVKARPVISSWTALLAYVRQALAHEAREQFRVLYLDRNKAFFGTRTPLLR